MTKEKRLRYQVIKNLKQSEFPVQVHAIAIVDDKTGEISMSSEMPLENNIAFLKYINYIQKER